MKAGAILIGSIAVALGITNADAASIPSNGFVAVVEPISAFLAASSQLAEANSAMLHIRAFARSEIRDQATTEREIISRRDQDRLQTAKDASAPTVDGLGPVANAITIPFSALADVTSVANPPLTPLPSEHRLDALSRGHIREMSALQGSAFDAYYVERQTKALGLLVKTYNDFILNGDDPRLRAIAVHDLPRLQAFLATLRRLRV